MTLSPALFFVIPSPVTIVSVILFILAYLFYRCVLSYPGSDLLGGKYAQRSQSVVWRAFMEHRINKDPRTLYGLNMRCEDGWNVDLLRESSLSMLDVYPQVPVTESQRTSANGRSTHISHETNSADKPNEQFIFGCHPHGPMAVTLFMMKQYPSSMLDLLFPTIRLENIRCLGTQAHATAFHSTPNKHTQHIYFRYAYMYAQRGR